jgi:predicted metalloendopeptidase
VGQPFKWFSSPDKDNSTVCVGVLYQNGLTIPDRDYHLSPDAKYATFRAKLAEYIEQMLACAGVREAKSAALRIVALETRVANNLWTKVQNRDPVQTHNPMTLPDYQKLAPGFDWLAFFEGMGTPAQRLEINQPSFIKGHRAATHRSIDRISGETPR